VLLGFVPLGGQFPGHAPGEAGGQFRVGGLVGGEGLIPGRFRRIALGFGIPGGVDVRRDFKGRVIPADGLAGGGDFLVSQGRTVAIVAIRLVGGAHADLGLAADQGGLVAFCLGLHQGGLNGGAAVAVHVGDHLPAVGFKALRGIVGEPALDIAVDGNAVIVVEGDELAQAQGASQGAGFVGNPLHEATIPQEDVGVVIHDGVVGPVEFGSQQLFGNGHAHRVGDALAQGAGGGFHSRGVAHFRVARGTGLELAEVLQVLNAHRIARQVQQGVEQHGAVAIGEHKTVPVRPMGIVGIVLQVAAPQDFRNLRHAHGHARVTGIGFLNRVHGEGANGTGKGTVLHGAPGRPLGGNDRWKKPELSALSGLFASRGA